MKEERRSLLFDVKAYAGAIETALRLAREEDTIYHVLIRTDFYNGGYIITVCQKFQHNDDIYLAVYPGGNVQYETLV